MATSRILVEEPLYEEFCEKLAVMAKRLKVGDPTDPEVFIGPLSAESHCPFVQGQIDDAAAQGAAVIAGGVKESGVGREGGRYSMDEYTELKWLTFHTKGRL